MNAPIYGSFDQVCSGLGVSAGQMRASRLDIANDAAGVIEKMDHHFAQIEARQPANQRLDSDKRRDGAAAFTTNALAVSLAPVIQTTNENFLFVPGRAVGGALLPVRQTMPLGAETVEWEVIGTTGEAVEVGAGGLGELRRVGEGADKKSQSNFFFGVCYGWTQFDLWRDQLLSHRNLPMERAATARRTMDEKSERTGGEGSNSRKVPGFLNHGNVTTITLAKSFGDNTLTAEEFWDQLAIIDVMWKRANPRRPPTGVLMPTTHRQKLISLFRGNSDINAWKFALEAYPWLRSIIEDDRMLTASQTGGPMWQMWTASPQDLWRESQAAPMLFGPFEMRPLETSFILLQQDGGVICRDHRLIFRINQP